MGSKHPSKLPKPVAKAPSKLQRSPSTASEPRNTQQYQMASSKGFMPIDLVFLTYKPWSFSKLADAIASMQAMEKQSRAGINALLSGVANGQADREGGTPGASPPVNFPA
ncbi:hypothetical protein SDJN02_21552, partial [Cucurbita argyrosperma subsp. argyrosperma]